MPELVHRRISLLIPLFLGACGAPGPMPVRQATTAGPPKVSVTASVSSTGPVASSSADVPESPPPKRALRLPLESDRAWSPNGNGLALDGGIVDLVTKKVTPFACQYPRWVSDRYVVCETTGVLALDVEKGMVRSLPCKGNPSFGWGHYVACADDDVVVMDIATGDIRRIASTKGVVRFSGPGHILELGSDEVQRWDFDAQASIGSPYVIPTVAELATSRDEKFSAWTDADGTGHILDRKTGTVTDLPHDGVPLQAFGDMVGYFDRAGTRVAIPMKVGGVSVLDPGTAHELFTLTSPVCANHFAVAWSDDGKLLATGGSKGSVCVFDVPSRRLLASWSVPLVARRLLPQPRRATHSDPSADDPGHVVLLAFTPGGKGLVAGEDDPMGPSSCGHGGLYRSTTGKSLGDLGAICGSGYPTTEGEWIVGSDDRTLITKDLRIVPLRTRIVSPDGHHVLRDGRTIDSIEGAPRPPKLDHAEGATLVSFDPTGTKILGAVDDVPHVWSAVTGELLGAFE